METPILPDDEPASLPSERTMRAGDSAALGRIDHYELLRKLGSGGFGVVYLARDTFSGIEVAIKTLHPLLKHNAEEMEMLREQFSLVARLTHQNIAKALVLHRVRDLDVRDERTRGELKLSPGDSVMVMDYAPGVTLSKWRHQFPGGVVPFGFALEIGRQVAAALDYAHGEHIVHRDIKPGNIMVETQEVGRVRARLLDFGLAAEIRSSMSRVSTETGDTSGTRPYMAPEQWQGRKQDGRTDQYALACVLYELLSGAPPFAGVFETGDPAVMSSAVENRAPEPVPGFPRGANATLLRALAKDPAARFPSCTAFVGALAGRRDFGGRPFQRILPYLAAAALAVVAATIALTRKGSVAPSVAPAAVPSVAPVAEPAVSAYSKDPPASAAVQPVEPAVAPAAVPAVEPAEKPTIPAAPTAPEAVLSMAPAESMSEDPPVPRPDVQKTSVQLAHAHAAAAAERAAAVAGRIAQRGRGAEPTATIGTNGPITKSSEASFQGELKSEREAQGAEERARRAEADRQAVAAEEVSRVQAEVEKLKPSILAFEYDGVLDALKKMEDELSEPESREELRWAIARVQRAKDLRQWILDDLSQNGVLRQGYRHKYDILGVTSNGRELLLPPPKPNIPVVKLETVDWLLLIRMLLEKRGPERRSLNTMEQLGEQHLNAALFCYLHGGDNPNAIDLCKLYARKAVSLRSVLAHDARMLIPFLEDELAPEDATSGDAGTETEPSP